LTFYAFYYTLKKRKKPKVNEKVMGYVKSLKGVYFFKGLADSEIESINNVCHEITVAKGGIICEEESRADKFYIILSGSVEVWKDYNKPESDLLAVHEAGQLFGEMALIDDLPRSATVIAREETKLLYIEQGDFFKIIKENSQIAISIMKSVSSMVRKSNESFVEGLRATNAELAKTLKELKEAQEDLLKAERLSALGKFSSLILHDIRNPLSSIKIYAEMILNFLNDPNRIRNYIQKVIYESDRLHKISNELLDYSRGSIRLSLSIVNLKDLVNKFITGIFEAFDADHIQIISDIQFAGPILLDEERILRVFANLSDNSRKAMTTGGEFSIKIYKEGTAACIELADTGEGMSPDVLKKIFEPFFSYSKKGGTGLGMGIVKSIVEAHQGTIDVFSKENVGTTFIIKIPISGVSQPER
jgi:signal transduction histidine kinase